MMLKEDTGNVACDHHHHHHHHHDDDDDDAENDRRSKNVAGNTPPTTSGKIPKRMIEKEASLGSVISAITLDTEFGNLSGESSFSLSTRSLSSSKNKFEITLSPTLEFPLGEQQQQDIGASRFDASPLRFENSFNRKPMCLPERKPSEGSLVNNKNKKHRNKMRGKKNEIFQQQPPRRYTSPPRLLLPNTTTTPSLATGGVEPPLRCPERKPSGGAIADAVKEKRNKKKKLITSSKLNDVIHMNNLSNHSSPKKPERQPSDRLMTGVVRRVTKMRRQQHQQQHQQRSLSPR